MVEIQAPRVSSQNGGNRMPEAAMPAVQTAVHRCSTLKKLPLGDIVLATVNEWLHERN